MKSFDSVPLKGLDSTQKNSPGHNFSLKPDFLDLKTWFASTRAVNDNEAGSQISSSERSEEVNLNVCQSNFSELVSEPELSVNLGEWDFVFGLDPERFRQGKYQVHKFLKKLFPETAGYCCCKWKIMDDKVPIKFETQSYTVPMWINGNLVKQKEKRSIGVEYAGCGRRIAKPAFYCGNSDQCPICGRIRTVSQGARLFYELDSLPAKEYGMLTFTIPTILSEELLVGYHWDKKQIFRICRANVVKVMKKFFPDLLGYHVRVEAEHSRNVLGGPHFHVHVLFPCLKWLEKSGKRVLEGFRLGFNKKFDLLLDKIRIEWARLWSWSVPFVVHYEYCKKSGKKQKEEEKKQLRHMCNYLYKRSVMLLNRNLLKNNVGLITGERLRWLFWVLAPAGDYHRVTHHGQLSNSRISNLLNSVGSSLEVVWEKVKFEERLSRRCFCPWKDCGREIEAEEWKNADVYHSDRPPPFVVAKISDWDLFKEVSG